MARRRLLAVLASATIGFAASAAPLAAVEVAVLGDDVPAPVESVVQPVVEQLAPVEPVLDPVVATVESVESTVATAVAPLAETLTPADDVVEPVADVVDDVVDVVAPVLEPVIDEVAPPAPAPAPAPALPPAPVTDAPDATPAAAPVTSSGVSGLRPAAAQPLAGPRAAVNLRVFDGSAGSSGALQTPFEYALEAPRVASAFDGDGVLAAGALDTSLGQHPLANLVRGLALALVLATTSLTGLIGQRLGLAHRPR